MLQDHASDLIRRNLLIDLYILFKNFQIIESLIIKTNVAIFFLPNAETADRVFRRQTRKDKDIIQAQSVPRTRSKKRREASSSKKRSICREVENRDKSNHEDLGFSGDFVEGMKCSIIRRLDTEL